MREAEVPVTFQPRREDGLRARGTRLLEAAAAADLVLDAPCGGEGTCGKCRVIVGDGGRPAHTRRGNLLLRRGTSGRLPAGLPVRPSRAR